MTKEAQVRWLPEPEDHDYPAAALYLRLIFDERKVTRYVEKLRRASILTFNAKDIYRASGLSLLGVSNSHLQQDRTKILAGKSLSPLLLVRDPSNSKVIIADGYHRLCAAYSFDEDSLIPTKIV